MILEQEMNALGAAAKQATRALMLATTAQKNLALIEMAKAIRAASSEILTANAIDVEKGAHLAASFIDRLTLNKARIEAIAVGLEEIAALPDPVNAVMDEWVRPNGLKFKRVRVPLGVIGVIYESRPNVTADAGSLCMKAGNAVILRGGSDSFHSSLAIVKCLHEGLLKAGLPATAIQLVPTSDRAAVGMMLTGLNKTIDVIIPRGGKSLVARVESEARVPVFSHLEGNNHVYVEKSADFKMALEVLVNSKLRRTGVCGSAETLLIDEAASSHLPSLLKALHDLGCEIRGCAKTRALFLHCSLATDEDYATEFLDKIIAVKIVKGIDEAIAHIEKFGSHHTDAIITADEAAATRFMQEVTSAIVLHNASTQYADGGEFGFGAEIGIATGRLHARGPVGLEQLTTFNYHVFGNGQCRP